MTKSKSHTAAQEIEGLNKERQKLPEGWQGIALLSPARKQIVLIGMTCAAMVFLTYLINSLTNIFTNRVRSTGLRGIWEQMLRFVRPIDGTQANMLMEISGGYYATNQSKIKTLMESRSIFCTSTAFAVLCSQIRGYIQYFFAFFGLTKRMTREGRVEVSTPILTWIMSQVTEVRAYIFKNSYSSEGIAKKLGLGRFDLRYEDLFQQTTETEPATMSKSMPAPSTGTINIIIVPETLGIGKPVEMNGKMTVPQINPGAVMQQLTQILQGLSLTTSKKETVGVCSENCSETKTP